MTWPRRHKLVVFLLTAAAVATVAALAVGASLDPASPHKLRLELAKGLGTLAIGLWLGGLLKLATDNHAESKKKREEQEKHFDTLVGDLHGIHDRLETARLLIAAHRSAKTYGEQLRDLVAAHVVLLRLARTQGLGVLKPDTRDAECLASMLAYLQALEDEYEEGYKDVSNLQRYDEEFTKQTLAKHAERDRTSGEESRLGKASARAWTELVDANAFPVLYDLLSCGHHYMNTFIESCHALTCRLQAAGCRLQAAKAAGDFVTVPSGGSWLDEADVTKCVRERAKQIRQECEAAAKQLPGRVPTDNRVGSH